ncbi:MAG: hypothetical protein ACOC3W_03745 [Thermodesulfobacteriota bacterium]
MAFSNQEITECIDEAYRVIDLRKFMSHYGPPLMEVIPFSFKNKSRIQTASKKLLVREFAKVFSSQERFNAFYAVLDETVRKVLYHLVWEAGHHSAGRIKELFGAEFLLSQEAGRTRLFRPTEHIDPKYLLFRFREQFTYRLYDPQRHLYAYLPTEMQDLFKSFLLPPEGYHLQFLDEIPPTRYRFQDEGRVIGNLDLILAYIDQGHLKFSVTGEKILVRSLKEMAEYCKVTEFYPEGDPQIRYMRAALMIDFILDSVIPEVADPVHRFKGLILKQLFETATRSSRYHLRELLSHLNGFPQIESNFTATRLASDEDRVRANLFDLFSNLSRDRWVSAENLYTYCLYRENEFQIVDRFQAEHYLHYPRDEQNDLYFHEARRTPVDHTRFGPALMAPFIKGVMFLAAGFGLVDIAYDPPENDPDIRRKGKPYLSIFDGLRYVRLSELGAYILGKKDRFTAAVEIPSARIILDDRRLLITIEGDDKIKLLTLDQIGERIGEAAFRVTHGSFLKDCESEADIQRKIALFKEQVSDDPPAVWVDFFQEIQDRINPLTRAADMVLYKLKPDPELVSLMATDSILKKFILKAEGYHIAVSNQHLGIVTKRLASFGYFIDKL